MVWILLDGTKLVDRIRRCASLHEMVIPLELEHFSLMETVTCWCESGPAIFT